MEKVKISKDGASIDFIQSDKVPVSPKKFRQGAELEGFYRFIFENDLRKEALQVIDRIFLVRKAMKLKKPLEALKKQAVQKAQELIEKVATPVAPVKATAKTAAPVKASSKKEVKPVVATKTAKTVVAPKASAAVKASAKKEVKVAAKKPASKAVKAKVKKVAPAKKKKK